MTNEAEIGPGHNNPPLVEVLAESNKALIAEVQPLADKANALAEDVKDGISDEDQLAKVADLIVGAKALAKRLDSAREVEKKPFLESGRTVDAFFKAHTARLERIESAFSRLASDFQRKKAAEARRKADEEARRLREEEERKRQEAVNAKREDTTARKLDEADEIAAKAEDAEAKARAAAKEVAQVKTETGVSVGGKTEWDFEITDYETIPLDRLRPYFKREEVEKAIRGYLKTQKGAAKLEGVRFFEDVKATFRR